MSYITKYEVSKTQEEIKDLLKKDSSSLEVGLRLEKIPYENQRIVPIFYKEHNVGQGIPDIIINECKNGKIIIELKAVSSKLSLKEEVQLKKYMEVLNISKGVLINFPQPDSKKTPNEPEIIVIENKDEVKEYACYKCGRPIKHKGKCLNCNLKGKK